MNTTKNGMRSVLAAAAAGALVIGSASGAMATPNHGHHVAKGQAAYMQLTKVDIHRHSPINVNAAAVTRDLKVRATVRDTDKVNDPASVTVVLASYDKRKGAVTAAATPITVNLALKRTKHKAKDYVGTVAAADLKAAVNAANLAVGSKILLCIQSADLTATAGTVRPDAKQVTKKENGGDCVRIVNVVPSQTKTKTDDPKPAA